MANTFYRSSFRGARCGRLLIDCPRGVAPPRMPKADATGLSSLSAVLASLPKERAGCGKAPVRIRGGGREQSRSPLRRFSLCDRISNLLMAASLLPAKHSAKIH